MPRTAKRPARPVHSLHDAALECFDAAIRSLRGAPGDEAIHTARKACKRIRAALRLLRAGLGEAAYHRENATVRAAMRPLTQLRDVFILRGTLRKLPPGPPALAHDLSAEYGRERSMLKRHGAHAVLGQLAESRARVARRPPLEPEIPSALEGVRRVYRAGRKALAEARSRDDAALHEWRKQTKYLLNQLELLKELFSTGFKKMRRHAHEVGELLGDDHDLAVLRARLHRYPDCDPSFIKAIQARRRKLQARAFRSGKRLYRHSVKEVAAKTTRRLAAR